MAKEMTVTRANETLADIDHYETQMEASMKRLRTAVAA